MIELWRRIRPRGNAPVFILYLIFFALLLGRAALGVGQYWDWVFPYYTDEIGNFFNRASEAWTNDSNGAPLGYSSDYFFRFCVGLLRVVPPEILLFGVLVVTFTVGAFITYRIARHHAKPALAFLLGLVALVNPVIFYNFIAGYVDYLVAYTAFISLVYFLLYRFEPRLRSSVILGLLVTLIGVQIQLFVVAGVFIALFFVFRPEQLRWKYVPVMVGLPIVLSLVWLSNFLFGGASLSSVSGNAAKATFKGLADSNYLNIFSFSFSKATLISRFYNFYELLLYGLMFVLVVALLLRAKRKQAEDALLLVFMLLMLFLATGMFQLFNLGPLTTLYPMFREVGHFAPLIVLALVVLMARLIVRGWTKWLCAGWLVVVIFVSFITYRADTQSVNFASVRQQLAEFQQFGKSHQGADQRVLVYPFFDQLSFVKFPISFQNGLPLRNSGHDSFSAFSDQQFVDNGIKPQDFQSSVQYRLLQTLDVNVLQPYNVRYIYDLSNVYESYYDRYVPPATYNNDLSLIKNNPDFFGQLLAANPGKLKQVAPHILEITDYTPRVAATGGVYVASSADNAENARSFMEQVFPDQPFNYVTPEASAPRGSYGSVTPLFNDPSSSQLINAKQKSLVQTITPPAGNTHLTVYSDNTPGDVMYHTVGGNIEFYTASSGKLLANGHVIQDNTATPVKILGHIPIGPGIRYFASLNGTIMSIPTSGSGRIGTIDGDSELEVFISGNQNFIQNPSFESGLWQPRVSDCNDYDKNADISMALDSRDATDGTHALELSSRVHDACTYTNFPLSPDTTYVLSYDYQTQNTQSASFYLRFNNSDKNAVRGTQHSSDANWHTALQLITTPDGASNGQLTVQAQASDSDQPAVDHYDNFQLLQLREVGRLNIPAPQPSYTSSQLDASGATTFQFQDDSYGYQNVIKNGSFEQGAWQGKVTDCNNYDSLGSIAANLSPIASDGRQSLQLESTRHTACEYADTTVQPDTDYLLSFDYQGDPAQSAGYYLEFTGANSGQQDQIDVPDTKWHTYTTLVHIPDVVTGARLYLHALESDGTTKNIVRFDNVKLIAVPSVAQRFYVVSRPVQPLSQPKSVSFHSLGTTMKTASVSHASGPFVLSLSESYHTGWRLELNNAKLAGINAWRPGAPVDAAGQQFELNNYENAWYIDPAKLCAGNVPGCTRNADGSYNLSLVAEFVPQRWFVVSRAVSVGALVLAGGYVALTHRRYRRELAEQGVYRHTLAKSRRKK